MDNKKLPLKYYLYFFLLLVFFFIILFPYLDAFKGLCREVEDRSGVALNWKEEQSGWFKCELKDFTLGKDGKIWLNFPSLTLRPALAGLRLVTPAGENYLDAKISLAGVNLRVSNFAVPTDLQAQVGEGKISCELNYRFFTRKLNGHFQAQLTNTPLPLLTGTLELKGKVTGNKKRVNLDFETAGSGLTGGGSLKLTLAGSSWNEYPLSGNAEFTMAGAKMKYIFSGTAGAPVFTPEI
jgi:hypothetical protein